MRTRARSPLAPLVASSARSLRAEDHNQCAKRLRRREPVPRPARDSRRVPGGGLRSHFGDGNVPILPLFGPRYREARARTGRRPRRT